MHAASGFVRCAGSSHRARSLLCKSDAVRLCLQVLGAAKGMLFLHARPTAVLHRDLVGCW